MAQVSFIDAEQALNVKVVEEVTEGIETFAQDTQISLAPGATHRLHYTEATDVIGSGHNDYLEGDDRANLLRGGKGNDVIDGGKGNDRLNGGRGDDVFVIGAGDGSDNIRDDHGQITISFEDIHPNQLWFERDHDGGEDDLVISVLGTDQKVRVKDVFEGGQAQLERLTVIAHAPSSGTAVELDSNTLNGLVATQQDWAYTNGIPEGAETIGDVLYHNFGDPNDPLRSQDAYDVVATSYFTDVAGTAIAAYDPLANLAVG